ncbi:MAG: hypothetical protein LBJ44_07025 [Propionibacteriaceae bacterium]|jgi:hypothetical protein|nr:hypothetical protein [Propionibacteriaceae bacterium]
MGMLRVRIPLDNPIGVIIVSIIIVAVACGLVYALLSAIVEKILLPIMRVPAEKRDSHILSKIALWITLLVAVAGVVMVILPACGVDTGPLSLLDILGS